MLLFGQHNIKRRSQSVLAAYSTKSDLPWTSATRKVNPETGVEVIVNIEIGKMFSEAELMLKISKFYNKQTNQKF